MKTDKDKALAILRDSPDNESLLLNLQNEQLGVIREFVLLLKEQYHNQCVRDENTLKFYDGVCFDIINLIGNPTTSETNKTKLLDLLPILVNMRKEEKEKQDKATDQGKGILYLGMAGILISLVVVALVNSRPKVN